MVTKLRHHHSDYANRTIDWFSTDNKEFYEQNISDPKKKEIIERNGWVNRAFQYTFNSHGFRADEFNEFTMDSFLFLGCSYTLGTGVPYEVTWPYLVSRHYGVKNYNLGISGGSNDTAFRLANHYVPQLKPKLVLFAATVTNRLDMISDTDIITLRHNSVPDKLQGQFYKDWLTYEENCQLNWEKNLKAIKHICHINEVPFVEVKLSQLSLRTLSDNGRDIMHPGINSHQRISEYAINQIDL